jgi:hypothetical protein
MISVLASSAVDWSGQTKNFYYYPNSEPTSPCAISLLLCAWQRSNKQDEL